MASHFLVLLPLLILTASHFHLTLGRRLLPNKTISPAAATLTSFEPWILFPPILPAPWLESGRSTTNTPAPPAFPSFQDPLLPPGNAANLLPNLPFPRLPSITPSLPASNPSPFFPSLPFTPEFMMPGRPIFPGKSIPKMKDRQP